MARIKYAPIISTVKGSVGSGTFQEYSGGSLLRVKPVPRQTYSQSQYYARLFVKLTQEAWAGLTIEEQTNWSTFLNFVPNYQKHNPKALTSGFNLFLKYNLLRLHSGQSILTSFEYVQLASLDLTPTVYLTAGVLYVSFTNAFSRDTSIILFKVSPVLSSPRASLRGKLRKLPMGSFTPPGQSVFNITSYYYDQFGYVPVDGDKVLVGVTFFSMLAPIISKETFFTPTIVTI